MEKLKKKNKSTLSSETKNEGKKQIMINVGESDPPKISF